MKLTTVLQPKSIRALGGGVALAAILTLGGIHNAHAHVNVTILHTFGSIPNDAVQPNFELTQGPDGIYGVSAFRDSNGNVKSVAFKYSTSGVYSIIHTFSDGANANFGAPAAAPLTLGSDGNLYGVTTSTIFRMTPDGSVTTLYTFVGSSGNYPSGSLIEDTPGVFFGTTYLGGSANFGSIYKITSAGVYSTVYSFLSTSSEDAAEPGGPLFKASDGNYYGTARTTNNVNPGAIYKFTPAGVYSILQRFPGDESLGASPTSGVVEGPDGSLYGTTQFGDPIPNSPVQNSSIFKVTKSGVLTLVHAFSHANTGDVDFPTGALMRDRSGVIYGVARYGGLAPYYGGGIFQIDPNGAYSVTHGFRLSVEQLFPISGVIQGSDGSLYGTTTGHDYQAGAPSTPGTLYKVAFVPDPTITQISPATAPAGMRSLALTVTGANFYPEATIYLNGSPLPTTIDSSTQLRATLPAYAMQSPGSLKITVGYPNEGQTPAQTLTIGPHSALTSLYPSSVQAGQNDFNFVINGTGFIPGAQAVFNGAYITTHYVTPTQLVATVTRGYVTTPATVNVTVFNPNTDTDKPLPFTIIGPASPRRCAPANVQAGHASFSLSVTGAGFTSSTKVYWNGTALTTYFVSSTQVTAIVPASYVADVTTATIMVTPSTPATAPISFPVTAAPTLTSVSPASIAAGSPDFTLTATGTGFAIGAQITWNGSPLTTTYLSSMQLTATVPAASVAASGTASVQAANPGVAPTAPQTFTITP